MPLLLFVLLLLLASQWVLVEGVQTSKDDLAYLQRFMAATSAGQALGWNIGSDPCEDGWSGVTCDNDGKVIYIDVQDKGLLGTVPDIAENGSLSSLENLYLGGNAFTGALPMLPLPQLEYLRLDSNFFTILPEHFFAGLPNIKEFNITNNTAIVGWSLSEELRTLKQLHRFEASHAGVNGTLDEFFSNGTVFPFPDLLKVSLAANQLSGSVPEIKGSTIAYLDLTKNMLSGSISFITGLASSVDHLQLSHNKFTGPLPDFSGFTQLTMLSIDHNQITGVVPTSLPQLEVIRRVSLSGNLLQGPLPDFSSNVQTDVAKAVATGSFCRIDRGPCDTEVEALLLIAGAFGYPHRLAASWMRDDACAGWFGVHCNDHRRVSGINLSQLSLNGTMDSAFGSLTSLEAILLSGNNIVGDIPASVAHLPSLHVLDVSNNKLDGTAPKFRKDVAVWIEGNPLLKNSGSSLSVPSMVGVLVTLVITLVPVFHV